jgi:hypothetical protein
MGINNDRKSRLPFLFLPSSDNRQSRTLEARIHARQSHSRMATIMPSASSAFASSRSPSPPSSVSSLPELLSSINNSFSRIAALSNRVPGSAIVWRYLKASHQDDPLRTVLEILLVFFIVRTYLMARTKGESSGKNFVKFSEKV